ncbi:MAG: hypothetical protein J5700_03670, partial [Treponema sp.]|nr:hypothetical protein [Treponema sp.]
GTFDDATSTCDFAFAGARSDSAQTYTLEVRLYHKSGLAAEKKLVASGSQTVSVAGGDTSFAANVPLAPNTGDTAPKGSVGLSIKFSDTSVTSVDVQLKDSTGTDKAADYLDEGSTVTLTGGEGTIASAADTIPAGAYTLLMTFKNGAGAVVGSRTETVNIYPTMETNSWWTNGAATDTLEVSKYNQTEFWVKGTGGKFYSEVYTAATEAKDTNVGSFAAPLATVQAAVDKINATGNTTTQYTIYIDGKVTGDADADYSLNENSLVSIAAERKILFKGWTGPDTDIIDVNKSHVFGGTESGRAFCIKSASTITLQNLSMTRMSVSSGYGGAVLINAVGANVTLLNSKITNGYSYYGGAIAVQSGELILKQSVVTQNTAYVSGGGLYANGADASVKIEDSEISFNKSSANGSCGGGVFVDTSATVNFLSGIIGGDEADKGNTSLGKGGGVYIEDSGKFYMSGSARISGNNGSSGGGVYIQNGVFCMADSAIVGAEPSGLTEAAQADDTKHSNKAERGGGIYTSKPSFLFIGYKNETTPDP